MSLLLLLKGEGASETQRTPIRVREMVPMRVSLLATAPNEKTYRWSEDGGDPSSAISDLNDSDSVPGGYKDLTATLSRKMGIDYADLKRGTRIEVFGAGNAKIGEYELQRAPQVSGDILAVTPAAVGYENRLVANNTAQEIPIDADITAWGDTSARRRAEVPGNRYTNAQVEVLPAGSPDPANPTSFSRVPAISHSWSEMNNNAGANPDVAESWYDGLGVELGEVLFDFSLIAGITVGDANWNDQIYTSSDGVNLQELLADLDAKAVENKRLSVAASRFYLMLRDYFQASAGGTGKWETQWKNIRVLGRHGLPLYGNWPSVGILCSDWVAFVLKKWVPEIHFSTGPYGTIKPTRFIIPHLTFKTPTSPGEMIQQAARFELPEWGVWNGPTLYLNSRGEREGRKRWRVRARDAQLEDTGQQMDQVWNGVMVQAQATDGSTLYIGPAGCGLRYTSNRLLDKDPLNPANEAGIKRYAKIQMKGIATIEGMEETGEAFLEHSKLLDGAGRATLPPYIEDEHGMLWPYYFAHAGDLFDFSGSSIPGYRYAVTASRTRSSRSTAVDIDAPPDSFEAMMERLYAEYVGIGFESGG